MEEPLLAAQPDGVAHINEEEDDLFRMKELIRELPDDVLHFLADSGVVQLGEMEVAEELVAAAFGPEPLLVVGAEH
ncbi:transient receptor potential channel protein, partial [Haematococcus lacustris]